MVLRLNQGGYVAAVEFEDASRFYEGTERPAVENLNLKISDGEFLVLVGPSGCGKSTSLRMLAGLEPIDSGSVLIGEKNVTDMAPKDRDVAMVFQNYALYPHMSVAENMAFALKIQKIDKAEIKTRVQQAAKLLDLEPYLERKPKALSGGQRQRVAMGRAIVREPQVFLMDEPLSNLDAKLRVQTRTQIAELQRRLGVTTVYVTHDQVEAMTMGDRVAVMLDGVLQQVDTPRALYESPANVFVAGFIGSPAMSLTSTSINGDTAQIGGYPVRLERSVIDKLDGAKSVTLGVRPEDMVINTTGIELEVDLVEELGADAYLYGHTTGSDKANATNLIVRVGGDTDVKRGEVVKVKPNRVYAFEDGPTGRRLD